MEIKKLAVHEIHVLTELFDYNDVEQMLAACSNDIRNGIIDIFVLYDNDALVGELRAKYECDDENFAVKGRRAYLYAFRIRENLRGMGYGTYLLKNVLSILQKDGYSEFTVGVEDDNHIAAHMYEAMGFDELLLRKMEEYQGDSYEYNLYLKK